MTMETRTQSEATALLSRMARVLIALFLCCFGYWRIVYSSKGARVYDPAIDDFIGVTIDVRPRPLTLFLLIGVVLIGVLWARRKETVAEMDEALRRTVAVLVVVTVVAIIGVHAAWMLIPIDSTLFEVDRILVPFGILEVTVSRS